MEYKTLVITRKDRVGTITFNRPDKLNALSGEAFKEFIAALHEVDEDSGVGVVVITGAGRAFSAGLDMDEARKGPSEMDLRQVPQQDDVAWIPHIIRNMRKPVIAMLNGPTAGGGFTIALACDIRIASEEAIIGGPFLGVGLVPELGSTYTLPRLVGIAKACELVFTGRMVKAAEAKEIGLVNQVVPADELEATTYKMADTMLRQAPVPLQIAKKALYQGMDNDLVGQIQFEQLAQSFCFRSEDYKEGINAFMEKRRPEFKGK
jgi:enoyl-CoA hydratase/carnithine racemase